jgi:Na+/H+-dicarboxylate symporter
MKIPSLNVQILLGTVIGVLMGAYFHALGPDHNSAKTALYVAGLAGTLFIDLLKMILIPLVFCSIVVGIANLRQHSQMQRVWVITLVYFMATMMIAVLMALVASHLVKPGSGLEIAMFQHAMQDVQLMQMPLSEFFAKFLHGLFVNPFKALAESNVIAVVMFALVLGIAIVVGGERYTTLLNVLQEGLAICMHVVNWIMRLAPLGITALLMQLVATQDFATLGVMATFVALVVGTTLMHGLVVLPLILYWVTGRTPAWFWRGSREALLTAFATSSSSATLPVTMRCSTQHLGVKPEVAGFVLPLGATMNMDGTALYEAAAALFIANLVGVELSLMQQGIVFAMSMLAAVGAPGIPSAGMVTMVMVLQSVGLPAEAIAILLPIDRLLDTLRTTVNVQGDMIGGLVVQKLAQ